MFAVQQAKTGQKLCGWMGKTGRDGPNVVQICPSYHILGKKLFLTICGPKFGHFGGRVVSGPWAGLEQPNTPHPPWHSPRFGIRSPSPSSNIFCRFIQLLGQWGAPVYLASNKPAASLCNLHQNSGWVLGPKTTVLGPRNTRFLPVMHPRGPKRDEICLDRTGPPLAPTSTKTGHN